MSAVHAKLSLDGSRFHDERRLRSSHLARAFTLPMRAASLGAQSEVAAPDEVSLDPDLAIAGEDGPRSDAFSVTSTPITE